MTRCLIAGHSLQQLLSTPTSQKGRQKRLKLTGPNVTPRPSPIAAGRLADHPLLAMGLFGSNSAFPLGETPRKPQIPQVMSPSSPIDLKSRPRLPEWLRIPLPTSNTFSHTRSLLDELKLHTVCESAKCPNHWECWSKGTATFMIAGDRCTRACGFCAVATQKPLALDPDEPARVAEATRRMRLKHVVITAVARDDLQDGGSEHFRATIEKVRELNPGIVVEVLVPDFLDRDFALDIVLSAKPDIYNHNLETVRRLTPSVRHRATYDRSLSVLAKAKAKSPAAMHTKSGMMLGLGETEEEVIRSMEDLREANVDILTLGQYLQPTLKHLPVVAFVPPSQFEHLGRIGAELGFVHVASGPLVRSSYHADEFNPTAASNQ
jgi:lipoyl synthase